MYKTLLNLIVENLYLFLYSLYKTAYLDYEKGTMMSLFINRRYITIFRNLHSYEIDLFQVGSKFYVSKTLLGDNV